MLRTTLICGILGWTSLGSIDEVAAVAPATPSQADAEAGEPDFKPSTWSRVRRLAKNWLRSKSMAAFHRMEHPPASRPFGLVWDDPARVEPDRPLVVAVHGLHSGSRQAGSLLAGPRSAGYWCGTFEYPNDQSIAQSARLLADELHRFAEAHPGRDVALVTHSMGGIVARAVIEDPRLDPGNVSHLIMIAPPNHGSRLAYCNVGADMVEYLTDKQDQGFAEFFYRTIEDGLAEGPRDLRPGSEYLAGLNRRSRNENVRYTIVLGTRGPLTGKQLDSLRRRAARMAEKGKWRAYVGGVSERWLSGLDETVRGKGDGAVAVVRGRLTGVTDTVELEFAHTDVLRDPDDPHAQPVHDLVLDRLSRR